MTSTPSALTQLALTRVLVMTGIPETGRHAQVIYVAFSYEIYYKYYNDY